MARTVALCCRPPRVAWFMCGWRTRTALAAMQRQKACVAALRSGRKHGSRRGLRQDRSQCGAAVGRLGQDWREKQKMKSRRLIKIAVLLIAVTATIPGQAANGPAEDALCGVHISEVTMHPSAGLMLAHGGGLNSCGCHFNRKTGECHCHRNRGCGCECEPASCGTAFDNPDSVALPGEPAVMGRQGSD